jgi:hypothetical protein
MWEQVKTLAAPRPEAAVARWFWAEATFVSPKLARGLGKVYEAGVGGVSVKTRDSRGPGSAAVTEIVLSPPPLKLKEQP